LSRGEHVTLTGYLGYQQKQSNGLDLFRPPIAFYLWLSFVLWLITLRRGDPGVDAWGGSAAPLSA
jgi:hypothetical protein